MGKRFITIWFRHLQTDWFAIRRPELTHVPFALALPDHGRMRITSVNAAAEATGVLKDMAVADARAIFPSLQVFDDKPGLPDQLLKKLALWCIRFTPIVAVDPADGLILDVSGCAHLWGGEALYIKEIARRLYNLGYSVRAAMADTIGAAWAMARFGKEPLIISPGQQHAQLLFFPPPALRIAPETVERLHKLGLRQIKNFISMPRAALLRRFGHEFITRLDQAFGYAEEIIQPVQPVELWQERLPCLEPIVTAAGIEIALQRLMDILCQRLQNEQKGVRHARFICFRVDGKIEQVEIGTNRASYNPAHLFKLFESRLASVEPALGIEVFVLEAPSVEDISAPQQKLWESSGGLMDHRLSELIDRLINKIGAGCIHRYTPDEHHWPERSIKPASGFTATRAGHWKTDKPRPMQLLAIPQPIEVTAPIPDYPPMLFRYKGSLHKITKADGPERIEREWWQDQGQHRDYYVVEDEKGQRYWLFRSGHYAAEQSTQWFIHGFFA